MGHNKLRVKLKDKASFVVCVELTGGPGFNFGPIEKFLRAYNEAYNLARPGSFDFFGTSVIPKEFDFVGITLPQNPGGLANIKPSDILSQLRLKDLLGELDVMPHVTCKDHNAFGILSGLAGYRNADVESILVMTGDKPVEAKGVFELDSIGLLRTIRSMNNESYLKADVKALDEVHQFFPGAVVSPFKYTEGSLMQQYYKMEKKIACGAKFLITQVGWDWKKSLELFRYLDENNIDVPVIGNVYLLSTITTAPRLMHDIKVPGCFVSDELLAKVYSENVDDHLERAAQQVAMYKSLGSAGVDIGGVYNFDMFVRILTRAAEIGADWERFKGNLFWPSAYTVPGRSTEKGFYLYDQAGVRTKPSKPRKKFKKRFFNFFHRAILDPDYRGFHAFKKTMQFLRADKGKGPVYKLF
ncbi:MAG: methylenetetrahydrofolate reductase, partial [Phycisphaerales bacterium]